MWSLISYSAVILSSICALDPLAIDRVIADIQLDSNNNIVSKYAYQIYTENILMDINNNEISSRFYLTRNKTTQKALFVHNDYNWNNDSLLISNQEPFNPFYFMLKDGSPQPLFLFDRDNATGNIYFLNKNTTDNTAYFQQSTNNISGGSEIQWSAYPCLETLSTTDSSQLYLQVNNSNTLLKVRQAIFDANISNNRYIFALNGSGTFINNLTFTCSEFCPVGTVFNSQIQTCEECQKGYFRNMSMNVSNSCSQCGESVGQEGQVSQYQGQTYCVNCPIGRYYDNTSMTCQLCPFGDTTISERAANLSGCSVQIPYCQVLNCIKCLTNDTLSCKVCSLGWQQSVNLANLKIMCQVDQPTRDIDFNTIDGQCLDTNCKVCTNSNKQFCYECKESYYLASDQLSCIACDFHCKNCMIQGSITKQHCIGCTQLFQSNVSTAQIFNNSVTYATQCTPWCSQCSSCQDLLSCQACYNSNNFTYNNVSGIGSCSIQINITNTTVVNLTINATNNTNAYPYIKSFDQLYYNLNSNNQVNTTLTQADNLEILKLNYLQDTLANLQKGFMLLKPINNVLLLIFCVLKLV